MRRNLTKEYCFGIAKSYNNRAELAHNDLSVYNKLRINGWLDEACFHMTSYRTNWTFEQCKELALTCRTRNEFKQKYHNAWSAAHNHNWINDITTHMEIIGTIKKRCVYVYRLPENQIYVGLTYDMSKRHSKHKNKGILSQMFKKYNMVIEPEIVSNGYVDIEESIKMEIDLINEFKLNGFNVLNTMKGGQIGISKLLNYSIDELKSESIKYNNRWEFQQKSQKIYDYAKRYKLLDEICGHMTQLRKKQSKERCIETALKCQKYSDFTKTSEYFYARQEKFVDEIKQLFKNL